MNYKKKILLLITITLNTITFSQNGFGVFGGINYSYFTEGNLNAVVSKNSFGTQFGIFYEYEISEKIKFRPKISYSQQGVNFEIESEFFGKEGNQSLDFRLTYLNIPLDFKFGNKTYLIAGPQIGFLINHKEETSNLSLDDKLIDFGINLGVGVKFSKMFIELGIYQGISNITKFESKQYNKIAKVKNGNLQLTLGYTI
jgi:hypothetical protein